MRKRKKFTHIDTRPWIVVDVNGKPRSFYYTDEHGNRVNVYTFDGFRSANRAAKQFGGAARRQ